MPRRAVLLTWTTRRRRPVDVGTAFAESTTQLQEKDHDADISLALAQGSMAAGHRGRPGGRRGPRRVARLAVPQGAAREPAEPAAAARGALRRRLRAQAV